VKARAKRTLKTILWASLLNVLFFGFLTATSLGQTHQFILFVFLVFALGVVPIAQSARGLKALNRAQWSAAEESVSFENYRTWVRSRPIRFTWIILGSLLGVGALQLILGLENSIGAAGLDKPAFWPLPPGFGRSVLINVAVIALMGVLAYSIIDNAAHLGGFIAGIAAGCTLIKRGDPVLPLAYGQGLRLAGTLSLILILSFVGLAGYRILVK
jgi:hypothetical protein